MTEDTKLSDFGLKPRKIGYKGSISKNAVLLGNNFACDGYNERPIRVVTHAHYDHLSSLKKSLKNCEKVLMAPTTKNLLKILYPDRFGDLDKAETLECGESFEYGGEKITFHDANHIPGAVQVSLETDGGNKLLYTGDFKIPGAPIISADLLIIDSTYGKPFQTRPYQIWIKKIFRDFVKEKLEEGTVNVLGYHGKIQNALMLLGEVDLGVPALMPQRIYDSTEACGGVDFSEGFFSLETEEGQGRCQDRHVGFYHVNSKGDFDGDSTVVQLSGWLFDEPIREKDNYYIMGLSDHCDFNGLLRYVSVSNPEFVITDGSHSDSAEVLSREIENRLDIPSARMP